MARFLPSESTSCSHSIPWQAGWQRSWHLVMTQPLVPPPPASGASAEVGAPLLARLFHSTSQSVLEPREGSVIHSLTTSPILSSLVAYQSIWSLTIFK